VGIVGGVFLVLSGWLLAWERSEAASNGALHWIGRLSLLMMVVCALVSVTIYLINVPKFLVPRRLREEPGYVTEIRNRRGD
jgi:heme A synthase